MTLCSGKYGYGILDSPHSGPYPICLGLGLFWGVLENTVIFFVIEDFFDSLPKAPESDHLAAPVAGMHAMDLANRQVWLPRCYLRWTPSVYCGMEGELGRSFYLWQYGYCPC